jgi:hypothetical protein
MITYASKTARSNNNNQNTPIHTTLYELVAVVSDQLSPNEQSLAGPIVLDILAKGHCRVDAI